MKVVPSPMSASCWGVGIALALVPGTAFAQTAFGAKEQPSVGKKVADKVRLELVLEQLSQRLKCAILVEGPPGIDAVDASEVAAVMGQGSGNISIAEVEKVAASFDYAVERRRNLLLWQKRYTHVNDLPVLSLEECRETMRDIQTVIAPFRSTDKPRPLKKQRAYEQIIASFSPDQLGKLGDTNQGLSIQDLSPTQQDMLWKITLGTYLGTMEGALDAMRHQLDCARKEDGISLALSQSPQPNAFGYEFASPEGKSKMFRAFHLENGWVNLNGSSSRVMGNASTKAPASINKEKEPEPAWAAQISCIAEQAGRMNSRLVKQSTVTRIVVDDSIATKPITIIGEKYAGPEETVRGIAELFGLRVVKSSEGEWRIARHRAKPATSVTEIPNGILMALPINLLRAYYADDTSRKETGRMTTLTREPEDGSFQGLDMLDKIYRTDRRRTALRNVAVQRLRQSYDKWVKQERRERVPLNQLDTRAQSAFALVLMNDYLREAELLLKPAPYYIRDFNACAITGSGNDKTFFVSLGMRKPDGKGIKSDMMFGVMRDVKTDTATTPSP